MKATQLICRNSCWCLCLLVGAAVSASISAQDNAGEALLAEIDRAIDAARSRIVTFHVTYETNQTYARKTDDGTRIVSTNEIVEQWSRGDECRIVTVRNQDETSPANEFFSRTRQRHYLRTRDYRARWDMTDDGAKPLAILLHNELAFTQAYEKLDSDAHHFDITRFAFTPYMPNHMIGPLFRERRPLKSSEYPKAQFVNEDGGDIILYEFYDRRDESRPVMSATLEPAKGYVFTKFLYDNEFIAGKESGYYRYEWEAVYAEVDDGIWLPSKVRIESWRHLSQSKTNIVVLNCEANMDIPDELFNWEELGYPGETVFVTDSSGLQRELTVWDIDESLVPDTPYTEPVWVKMNEVIYPHLPPEESPVSLVPTSPNSPPPSDRPVEAAPPATAPAPEVPSARVSSASRSWLAAVALGVVLVFGAGWTLYRKQS